MALHRFPLPGLNGASFRRKATSLFANPTKNAASRPLFEDYYLSGTPKTQAVTVTSSGWLNASSFLSNGGTWTNTGNMYAADGSTGQLVIAGAGEGGGFFTNFTGLSVPSGATILGIEYRVKAHLSSGTESYNYVFATTQFDLLNRSEKARNLLSAPNAAVGSGALSSTARYVYAGAEGDVWGGFDADNNNVADRAWTPADFDSSFGVLLTWSPVAGATIQVDHVQMRVRYQEAAAVPTIIPVTGASFVQSNGTVVVNDHEIVIADAIAFVQTNGTAVVNDGEHVEADAVAFAQTNGTVTVKESIPVTGVVFAQTNGTASVIGPVFVSVEAADFTQTNGTVNVNAGVIVSAAAATFTQTNGVANVISTNSVNAEPLVFAQTNGTAAVKESIPVSAADFAQTNGTASVKENISVVGAGFTQTNGSLAVNARVVVPAAEATFTQTNGSAVVNAKTTISIDGVSFAQTNGTVTVNARVVIPAAEATFTQTNGAASVNQSVVTSSADFVQTNGTANVNARVVLVAEGAEFAQTGGNVSIHESVVVEGASFSQFNTDINIFQGFNVIILATPATFVQTNEDVAANARVILPIIGSNFEQTNSTVGVVETIHVEAAEFVQTNAEAAVHEKIAVEGATFTWEEAQAFIGQRIFVEGAVYAQDNGEVSTHESIAIEGAEFTTVIGDVLIPVRVLVDVLNFNQENYDVKVNETISAAMAEFIQSNEEVTVRMGADGSTPSRYLASVSWWQWEKVGINGARLVEKSISEVFLIKPTITGTLIATPVLEGVVYVEEALAA